MRQYQPATPFNVPLMLLVPTYTTISGVPTKTFPAIDDGILFYGSFKTFGGTEIQVNGLYSIENTANIETWYRPDIKSDCRIGVPDTGAIYEVFGEPENINMRNQYLKMKVRQVKGGA